MPITYIVGPANSSKSTLLESYRKEVPPGVEVVTLQGNRGLHQKYANKGKTEAITFFVEEPSAGRMRDLLSLERENPKVQLVVTINDGGFLTRFLSNVTTDVAG